MPVWNLFLKGHEGNTMTFTQLKAPTEISVANLKGRVQEKNGIPPDEQRLIFDGKQLEDGKKLSYYNICDGATVFLVMRLHGGSATKLIHPPVRVIADSVPRSDEECMIMATEDDNVRMPCGHTMSPNGLIEYAWVLLHDRRDKICCCKCDKLWSMDVIERYGGATKKEMNLFREYTSLNVIRKDPKISECPGCQSFCARIKESDRCVQCRTCTKNSGQPYFFCWDCKKKWIGSIQNKRCGNDKCGTVEKLELLKKCPEKKITHLSGLKAPSTRACPRCGSLIEHGGQCKHMKCKVCDVRFCFVCLRLCDDGSWPCGSYDKRCKVAKRQTIIPRQQI